MRLAWLTSAMSLEKNRWVAALVVWRQRAVFLCGDDLQASASSSASMGDASRSTWFDAGSGLLTPPSVAVNMERRSSDLERTAVAGGLLKGLRAELRRRLTWGQPTKAVSEARLHCLGLHLYEMRDLSP
jgi:hypothetical protein